MKSAVLIHGCHLDSKLRIGEENLNWQDLVIGSPNSSQGCGRATYGVLLALREGARVILFSTGASQKDGIPEAMVTYKKVCAMADWFGDRFGMLPQTFASVLKDRSKFDTVSQNTKEELIRNLPIVYDLDCRRVFLVTNRFHAPRVLAEAAAVRQHLGLRDLDLFVTCPDDETPAPVIFEPPTRGDRQTTDFRATLAKIFKIPPERQEEARAKLDALLDGFLA